MGGIISYFWPANNTRALTASDYGPVEDEEVIGGNMGAAASTISRHARPGRTHKMVFVANTELGMGKGKLAAQVGHACLGVYRHAMSSQRGQDSVNAWFGHGQVKVVVKGKDTAHLIELNKKAKSLALFTYLVQDAGYTQIPAGSRTILAVFGPLEDVDQVTGDLKLM